MAIDVSCFCLSNVADSCAIWNMLSSRRLYGAAVSQNCAFCCTQFVYYESLIKRRSAPAPEDSSIQGKFREEIDSGRMTAYHMDIEDLQDLAVLEARRRLGKGELSSIVFARKTGQAFLTDDQKARKLAATILDAGKVQTTPHLLGWLFFCGILGDSDITGIVAEHTDHKRPLGKYLQAMYEEGMRCQLLNRMHSIGTDS